MSKLKVGDRVKDGGFLGTILFVYNIYLSEVSYDHSIGSQQVSNIFLEKIKSLPKGRIKTTNWK